MPDLLVAAIAVGIVAVFIGIAWIGTSWMAPPPHVNTVPTVMRKPTETCRPYGIWIERETGNARYR